MENNFENIIKNSLENHEVPYEAGAWEKFDKATSPSPNNKTKWFIGGVAIIALISAVTLYTVDFNSTNNNNNTNENDNNKLAEVNSPSLGEKSTLINTKVDTEIKTEEVRNTSNSEVDKSSEIKNNDTKNINDSELGSSKSNDDNSDVSNPLNQDNKNSDVNIPQSTKQDSVEKPESLATPNVNLTPPSASYFLEKTICSGEEITLLPDNIDKNYQYSWKINDEEIVEGSLITKKASLIGVNTVTLFISQDGLQIAEKKSNFEVVESPSNYVKIELNQASLINELNFEMDETYNKISWDFGDGTKSEENNANHTYKKAGKYVCKYTITAINGCSTTFERNINVKGYYNLRTDYGFSPGKRDFINDEFIPVELKDLNVPFEMNIYARSGQLIYTTTSIDKPWEGRMKDNTVCPFGSYVWVVTLTNKLGEKEVYKGTVTNVNN